MQFIHSSLVFGFFSVERQRLSNEGAEGTTMSGEKAESEKEMKMELQSQVEEVNNQLQLVKSEKSQYAGKCHDLEKEIKTSEDIRKDLSKKCSELEQQLILKKREWSWEYEEMRRELEAKLEQVKNRLQLAESEKSQYAGKCHDLEKQIKASEDIRKDRSKKCSELEQQLILKEREWSWEYEEMRRGLEAKLEEVNNQLQLAESEKSQYAGKCHDLEKRIESSEDIRKDLSKKCDDLEQQLILKEREWSLECKKMRSELEAKLKDVKNRELEAKLEEVNNQLQLAESKVNMLASTMIWKNR